jgi:hypothetical protein
VGVTLSETRVRVASRRRRRVAARSTAGPSLRAWLTVSHPAGYTRYGADQGNVKDFEKMEGKYRMRTVTDENGEKKYLPHPGGRPCVNRPTLAGRSGSSWSGRRSTR